MICSTDQQTTFSLHLRGIPKKTQDFMPVHILPTSPHHVIWLCKYRLFPIIKTWRRRDGIQFSPFAIQPGCHYGHYQSVTLVGPHEEINSSRPADPLPFFLSPILSFPPSVSFLLSCFCLFFPPSLFFPLPPSFLPSLFFLPPSLSSFPSLPPSLFSLFLSFLINFKMEVFLWPTPRLILNLWA